jgi:hypothetical protein
MVSLRNIKSDLPNRPDDHRTIASECGSRQLLPPLIKDDSVASNEKPIHIIHLDAHFDFIDLRGSS